MAWDIVSDSDNQVFFKDGDIVVSTDNYQCDLNTANSYLQEKRNEYVALLQDTGLIGLLYDDLDKFLKENAPSVAIIDTFEGDGADGDLGDYKFVLGKIKDE